MAEKRFQIRNSTAYYLLYDNARIYRYPSARIRFQGRSVTLYLGKRTPVLQEITMEEAYGVLEKYAAERKVSGGKRYIGRSLSINAKCAYERGIKPLPRITLVDLKGNGFYYPVGFFAGWYQT